MEKKAYQPVELRSYWEKKYFTKLLFEAVMMESWQLVVTYKMAAIFNCIFLNEYIGRCVLIKKRVVRGKDKSSKHTGAHLTYPLVWTINKPSWNHINSLRPSDAYMRQ